MGAPSINVIFTEMGTTAITRGDRGIVVLLLKDDTIPETNPVIMGTVADIPKTLKAENQEQILLAFKGYTLPPKKVIAYVVNTAEDDYTEVQNYLETLKWNYFAFPEIADLDVEKFATWIKQLRDTVGKKVKAVLPNCKGDHEGIINYTNTTNFNGIKTYTAKQYCARMAGLLAGTPLKISATYAPVTELVDCDHLTKAELDTAVDAGKLVLTNDGDKVKVVRAVNSFTTTIDGKGKSFKKIKLVDMMDQITDDITSTVNDNYIGKVPNDYDHKVLLISAIEGYFEQLELDGLLQKGSSSVFINLPKQSAYLKGIGVDVSELTEQELKEYNTDDKVFIGAKITILDTMEDINLDITI